MANIEVLKTGMTPGKSCEVVNQNFTNVNTQLVSHVTSKENPHSVTKQQVGLGNVDNTSDADKPISTAQQEALDNKVSKISQVGEAGEYIIYAKRPGAEEIDDANPVTGKSAVEASTVVIRDASGNILVPEVNESAVENQAVPKNYVDTQISSASTVLQGSIDGLAEEFETIKAHAVGDEGSQTITGDLTIKKEGTSTGDLVVQGNLTVQGTTVTESQQSLLVEDNMIVANAGGATLTQLSGLAIKKNSTNVYGLVYDPTDDSVNLGLGTLDADNEFTFNDGEGLPVAVRALDSDWIDGHLVAWDATTRSLKDGGAVPTTLPNPNALNFGSKTYNGSTTQTITAADLGALTEEDAEELYQPKGEYLTSIPLASSSRIGGMKLGADIHAQEQEYPVQLDGAGAAFVQVPWVNTTYGIPTQETAGVIKLGSTNDVLKQYGLQVDENGGAYVEVPWSDTNTVTTIGANDAGYTSGNINFVGGGSTSVNKDGNTVTITTNTVSYSGGTGISISGNTLSVDDTVVVTSGNQTIGGSKTFSAASTFSAGITSAGITATGNIMPDANNTRSIGSSTNKFSTIYGNQVFGAVYNDYAEYRLAKDKIPAGYVVTEIGNDKVDICRTKKPKGKMFITTDTYGFCIGEDGADKNAVPVAMAGRVLIYMENTTYKRKKVKIGDYIGCDGIGRGRKMSRLEAWLHPHRVLGTVSSIPDYRTWGTSSIAINNRIWVNIK